MGRKVALIGIGNLAHSLLPGLKAAGCEILQLISRNQEKLKSYQEKYQVAHISKHFNELHPEAELVFLCLPDSLIQPAAEKLAETGRKDCLFLHTSGSIPLKTLEVLGERIGVFYPMQIFTKDRITPFEDLPLFLEGNEDVYPIIDELAKAISNKVYPLDSEDRLRLHMGAVMVCNFTNYLYRMAEENMPQKEGVHFNLYEPLIREHIDKVFNFGPQNTQTGPAIRKDLPTILQHLHLLEEKELQQDLYWEMSKMIRPDLEI
ncbi:MAG: DUF2520 domain-containing protein [Bacteroidota bacterium]